MKILKITFASVLVLMLNLSLCFADSRAIPSFSDSNIATIADFSSAVLKIDSVGDMKNMYVISVCTKVVNKDGGIKDTGVWRFASSAVEGEDNPIYISTNSSKEYTKYYPYPADYKDPLCKTFFQELLKAALNNKK